MALIELGGKYAVGQHRFATVDDAELVELSRWRWKAKPNGGGNNVYAVRNTLMNGRNVTLRMHRVILGLEPGDAQEVDHRNHNALDNRRSNLRIASRSQNILNSRTRTVVYTCGACGADVAETVRQMSRGKMFCSMRCAAARRGREQLLLLHCAECGAGMTGRTGRKLYCSDRCRGKAKRSPLQPGVAERVLAALNRPRSATVAAAVAGTHVSAARRALAKLVREGSARAAGKAKDIRGWSVTHYVQALT